MIITKRVSQWKVEMASVLESKVDEFKLMGYSRATGVDVWNCLTEKVWKGDPEKRLHEVVEDIFHLSSNKYMSYLTVQTYKDDTGLLESIAAITGSQKE
ncbi:post-transcriptional regulator [Aquibacillus rhizosphaerae]|uniref:Post-transcriptional regulator n=1 Tax=Aquibacillus rhizosphaerae TaxID=3051431 RepID=A0ABT7LA65_9BACI|nr:post-transcriptional regulator [Aquibacillus sp. LR5S19]MDL4841431.1 post-transcriptional regulator [Aquibacillus sp. LR5S19]